MSVVLAALLSALFSGGIVAIYTARAQKRKTNAEAEKTDAEAEVTLGGGWQVLWQSAKTETNELRERMALVEASATAANRRADAAERREVECQDRLAKVEAKVAHVSQDHVEQVVADMIERRLAAHG